MKKITLNKTNTKHIAEDRYGWTPDNSEPYDLIVEDGISINTHGGYIYTGGGYIYTGGGYINTHGGNIDTGGGYIYTHGGYIDTGGGYIYTGGGYINTHGGYINTDGGNIYTRGGHINTSGGYIDCGILYWRSMHIPTTAGGKITCISVYPDECTRSHWVERLSGIVDVSSGCYDKLLERVRPRMQEILALDKWSQCERWIIESWA
jgi:hypothetical protein